MCNEHVAQILASRDFYYFSMHRLKFHARYTVWFRSSSLISIIAQWSLKLNSNLFFRKTSKSIIFHKKKKKIVPINKEWISKHAFLFSITIVSSKIPSHIISTNLGLDIKDWIRLTAKFSQPIARHDFQPIWFRVIFGFPPISMKRNPYKHDNH